MPNGIVYPAKVIEGRTVTITCKEGFKPSGSWQLLCRNGTLKDLAGNGIAACIPVETGLSSINSLS